MLSRRARTKLLLGPVAASLIASGCGPILAGKAPPAAGQTPPPPAPAPLPAEAPRGP